MKPLFNGTYSVPNKKERELIKATTRNRNASLPFTEEQVKQISEYFVNKITGKGRKDFQHFRNSIMFMFQFYMGLRPAECFRAKDNYLDFDKKNFFIPIESNKQRQQDFLDVPDILIEPMKLYLARKKAVYPTSDYIFPSSKGDRHLDRSQYDRILREALKKLKLYYVSYTDKQGHKRSAYNAYSLRKGFGTLVYKQTKDILSTKMLMRHKNLNSTLHYIYFSRDTAKEIINDVFARPENPKGKTIINNTTINNNYNILINIIQKHEEEIKELQGMINKLLQKEA